MSCININWENITVSLPGISDSRRGGGAGELSMNAFLTLDSERRKSNLVYTPGKPGMLLNHLKSML